MRRGEPIIGLYLAISVLNRVGFKRIPSGRASHAPRNSSDHVLSATGLVCGM